MLLSHLSVCVCVCPVCTPYTDKVPHFSRLGDVEVNAGQNASFQCVATGKVSESEPFLLEVRTSYLFYYLCLSSQPASQHLHNRIRLGMAGRRSTHNDKEERCFTCFGILQIVLSKITCSYSMLNRLLLILFRLFK